MNIDKPLPQNIEAEQACLGSILIDGQLIKEASKIIAVGDFYVSNNQKIYQAMIELNENGTNIDVVTLSHHMDNKGIQIDGEKAILYLTYLVNLNPVFDNIKDYCKIIKEISYKRKLYLILQENIYNLEINKDPIEDIVSSLTKIEQNVSISQSSKLQPISAADLESITPPEPLWGNILYPGSITLCSSEPGVGKTTFAYNICVQGASEKPLLGLNFSKKIKSLYIDAETPTWLRKNKLSAICSGNLPEELLFLEPIDFKNEIYELIKTISEYEVDLLIIDTYSRICGLLDENSNSEVNLIMNKLREIAKDTEVSILLIHHLGKSENNKEVYGARGASALPAAADVVLNMEAVDDEIVKMKIAKNRINGDKQSLYLRKAGEDKFEVHIPTNDYSGFEKFQAQDIILSLPTDQNYKTAEIIQKCLENGFSEATSKRAKDGLVQSGKLQKVKHGLYKIDAKVHKFISSPPKGEKDELLTFSNDHRELPDYLR